MIKLPRLNSIIYKNFISLLLIILVAAFLRLIFLERIPTGLNNDELVFILNAKSFFLTGQSITYPKAELTHFLISPLVGFFDFSLFVSRLSYALASIILVVIIYLLTLKIFNMKAALIVGLIAAINPWSIYFGRTAYESPLSVAFLMLGVFLLIQRNRFLILSSFIFFALGFFNYMGAKLILLPLIFIVSMYSWKVVNKKNQFFIYVLLFFLCIMISIFSVWLLKTSPNKQRFSEIAVFPPKISMLVDTERRLSIENPLTRIFANKPVILLKEYFNKYFGFYSVGTLFMYGESNQNMSLWFHGLFYYLDLFFLPVGFYYLFRKRRSEFFLFLGILAIAPIPSVVSNFDYVSYANRSGLAFPVLIIIVGLGIYYSLTSFKKNTRSKFLIAVIFLSYIFLLLNFINIYFFRNPIYNQESFGFSSRILSNYLARQSSGGQRTIVVVKDSGPDLLLGNYLFYKNSLTKSNATEVLNLFKEKRYEFDNIIFTLDCPKDNSENYTLVISRDSNCNFDDPLKVTIPNISDGGTIYNIYNDKTCRNNILGRYPKDVRFSDLNVEKLSNEIFCTKYITNLNTG